MRQVTLAGNPVVGAGIALDDGAVKAAAVGQVVGLGAYVPLAGDVGAVAAVLQQGGHRHHIGRHGTQIAGLAQMLAGHGLAQVADAIAVVVYPGEQHRAGWGAGGRRMEVSKAGSLLRQRVDIRRGNFAAKCANISKAPVVCDQYHDVGASRRRAWHLSRRCLGCVARHAQ